MRAVIGVLALAGAGIAAYLTLSRYSGDPLYCPVTGSGCAEVQGSRYAEVAGIPVALLGLVAYIAFFATALVAGQIAAAAGAAIAISGAAFSAWLLYAQLVLVGAVCQWCVASDIVIALAAGATILRLRQST